MISHVLEGCKRHPKPMLLLVMLRTTHDAMRQTWTIPWSWRCKDLAASTLRAHMRMDMHACISTTPIAWTCTTMCR